MSFQAYLDNIEAKTGKTPQEFIELAKAKGFDSPKTKATEIINWLKLDFDLGRGHAMALVHVIQKGNKISPKHLNSSTNHSDDSLILNLAGKLKPKNNPKTK